MRATAVVLVAAFVAIASASESDEYDLRVLSKQVRALVERRAEDLRSIEESVRRTVFNGPEVEELRDQVRSLK